jgi:hypothetical protein
MQFPQTLVINLADRPEKWKQTQDTFQQFPVELERLDAVRKSPGWKGCAASHFKAIELAKQRGYNWVLILEDDAQLSETGLAQFNELLPILYERRSEWDIFLGGATFVDNVRLVHSKPPIYQAGGFTTHFCLIHNGSYDKILNQYTDGPIDVYYKEKMRLWMTNPHISTQRPGVSDIEQGESNYNKLFDDSCWKLWFMGLLQTYMYLALAFIVIIGFVVYLNWKPISLRGFIRRIVQFMRF